MSEGTLLLGSILLVAEGAAYAFVGWRINKHHGAGANAVHAARAFTLWWTLIGANKAAFGLISLAVVMGLASFPLYLSVLTLAFLVLALSLASLVYYLLFLLTGRRGWGIPAFAFYLAYYVLLTYHVLSRDPVGVSLDTWRTNLIHASPPNALLGLAVVAIMVLPQSVLAIAYFFLVFRVHDRTRRYRIVLVSWSILAWTASLAIIAFPGAAEHTVAQVATRVVGVTAALTCLLAYAPPPWIQRRLHAAASPAGEPAAPSGA